MPLLFYAPISQAVALSSASKPMRGRLALFSPKACGHIVRTTGIWRPAGERTEPTTQSTKAGSISQFAGGGHWRCATRSGVERWSTRRRLPLSGRGFVHGSRRNAEGCERPRGCRMSAPKPLPRSTRKCAQRLLGREAMAESSS